MGILGTDAPEPHLSAAEERATEALIQGVCAEIPAELVWSVLFGSKARQEARPESDVDVLFVFADLPPDREPHATMVEELADRISDRAGMEVAPWSVSLLDLQRGMRTPMLVDALADGIVLWPRGEPLPRPPFTPADAIRCTGALLQRVEEGSAEAELLAHRREWEGLARRIRDDIVRLGTGLLLTRGETRPRRAEVARRIIEIGELDATDRAYSVLGWVMESFGPTGHDAKRRVSRPPVGFAAAAAEIDRLRGRLERARNVLIRGAARGERSGPSRFVYPDPWRQPAGFPVADGEVAPYAAVST